MSQRTSDESIEKRYAPYGYTLETYTYEDRTIRYIDSNSSSNQILVFIHGAPGWLDTFGSYLKDNFMRENYRMIAVDRPGYSSYDMGDPITDIAEQAEYFSPLIKNLSRKWNVYLISHSYGVPVAGIMWIQHNDTIKWQLMLAWSVYPEHEPMPWYARLAAHPTIEKLLPKMIQATSIEKKTHENELAKIRQEREMMMVPMIAIHGEQDRIVPVQHIELFEQLPTTSPVTIYRETEMNHLIPFQEEDYVKQKIGEMLQ